MTAWAEGDPLEVAPRLLGAVLTHGGVSVRLTEVEAYAGPLDPGSHAHRGQTARNAVMFGPPGRLYVYFVYGMHHCANLVTGPEGDPGAVLLRAGEVVAGLDVARERRPSSRDRDLARGPARLCRVLGIDLADNGIRPDLVAGEPVARHQHRAAGRAPARSRASVAVLDHRRPHRQHVPARGSTSRHRPLTCGYA